MVVIVGSRSISGNHPSGLQPEKFENPGPGLHLDQGFLTGGKFPPWGKYWEFRGEMRAFENCCLFKTGDTKWFPYPLYTGYSLLLTNKF